MKMFGFDSLFSFRVICEIFTRILLKIFFQLIKIIVKIYVFDLARN